MLVEAAVEVLVDSRIVNNVVYAGATALFAFFLEATHPVERSHRKDMNFPPEIDKYGKYTRNPGYYRYYDYKLK